MFPKRLIATILSMLSVSQAFAVRHTMATSEKEVVSSWLGKHPGYRLATDRDCSCDLDLKKIRSEGYGGRWSPVPNYHPYTVVGDFNGDGKDDLAVAVIRTKNSLKFTILVFNGPIEVDEKPSFIDADSNMTGVGFFFGSPRPKPYRLVVGAFESEGFILIPKGQTYRIEAISTENE